MVDIDELEKLAREATPGPWEVDAGGYVCTKLLLPTPNDGYIKHEITGCYINGRNSRKNHKFIAAANPHVILELIKLIKEKNEKTLR